MTSYLPEWLTFLKTADWLIAVPLGAVGVVLLLQGWRIWKAAVIVTFGVIGAIVGVYFGDNRANELMFGAIGFVVLAAVSFPPVNYSVAVLGGIIGAGLTKGMLDLVPVTGPPLWTAVAVALLVLTAVSYTHLRHVIIAVTAFQGACLIISALIVLVAQSSWLYNYFSTLSRFSSIFGPFIMLVPTAIGCMLQLADVNQKDSGAAKAS